MLCKNGSKAVKQTFKKGNGSSNITVKQSHVQVPIPFTSRGFPLKFSSLVNFGLQISHVKLIEMKQSSIIFSNWHQLFRAKHSVIDRLVCGGHISAGGELKGFLR